MLACHPSVSRVCLLPRSSCPLSSCPALSSWCRPAGVIVQQHTDEIMRCGLRCRGIAGVICCFGGYCRCSDLLCRGIWLLLALLCLLCACLQDLKNGGGGVERCHVTVRGRGFKLVGGGGVERGRGKSWWWCRPQPWGVLLAYHPSCLRVCLLLRSSFLPAPSSLALSSCRPAGFKGGGKGALK